MVRTRTSNINSWMLISRIIRRDLIRLVRNPIRTFLLFCMPLSLAVLFSLAFSGSTQENIRIRVLLYDQDEGLVSKILSGVSQDERLEVIKVGPEGYEMIENGEASALVHIPKGFSRVYLKGQAQSIKIIKNPSEQFLPGVVEEGLHLGASVLSMASALFRPELMQLDTLMSADEFPANTTIASLSLGFSSKIRKIHKIIDPPQIKLDVQTLPSPDEKQKKELGVLAFILPGLAFMGVFFLAQNTTRDIVRDRESGLLRHLLTTPISARDYLFGKCLSVMCLSMLGFGVFILVGYLAGVQWGSSLAVAALVTASSFTAGGTMVLLMSFTRTERQADSLTTIVIIVWSMLGGAFLPVSQMPSFIQSFVMVTPVYWTTSAFEQLIVYSRTCGDILIHLSVLIGIGLVCTSLGVTVLGRKISVGIDL